MVETNADVDGVFTLCQKASLNRRNLGEDSFALNAHRKAVYICSEQRKEMSSMIFY